MYPDLFSDFNVKFNLLNFMPSKSDFYEMSNIGDSHIKHEAMKLGHVTSFDHSRV